MSDVYFLVDLRKSAGFGHFVRTYPIAENLKLKKNRIFFISNTPNLTIKNFLIKKKIKVLNYKIFNNLNFENQLIIIDNYSLKKEILKFLSEKNYTVMFSDFPNINIKNIDLIINNNLFSDLKKNKINYLIGKKYFILRDAISKQKINKKKNKFPKNIYLSLGGSIKKKYLLNLLKNLKEIKFFSNNKISLFINTNKYRYEINKLFIKDLNIKIKFIDLKIDNKFRFNKIDLSINGGGLTSIEMIYLKIPQIIICLSKNQKSNIQYIKSKKIGLELNKKILEKKIDFSHDFSVFLKRYKQMKLKLLKNKYIDNLGVKRIITRITYLKNETKFN